MIDAHGLDPASFRAYDIRGIVPDQISVVGAEQIARAFAAYLKPETVVLGRDVRLTGPELQGAVADGLRRSGVNVIDIDEVATDEFYFACAVRNLPGVMVTASHNPPEYNGFKLVERIPVLTVASEFKDYVFGKTYDDAPHLGTTRKWNVEQQFDDHMLSIVPPSRIRPLKVVVDASNGALGRVWQRLSDRVPGHFDIIFGEPDGRFPNHGNDIVQPANQRKLQERVTETEADVGLIFDPDGDRCLAVDDRGESVPGDFLTALLAVTRLAHAPGSTIVYDVRCSEAVPDLVRAAGGEPYMWRPGHAYIKPKMQEFQAIFGGELSGHFYFREFWYSDSGTLAGLTLLEYIGNLKHPLSTEVAKLRSHYFLSGEINRRVRDPAAVVSRIERDYESPRTSKLSGYAAWFDGWKFVVRPSDNEPLLRLTVEANTQALMAEKRDELLAIIDSYPEAGD